MTGPVEWLAGHLAEAEKDARAADGVGVHAETWEAAGYYLGAGSPEAALRLVAGARQILAEHANDYGDCAACGRPSEETNSRGHAFFAEVAWPCRTVRLLAEAWGWEETT